MFNNKPYVVPQKALNALFVRPEFDSAVNQIAEFVKDFMNVETVFLDLEAARGEVASVVAFDGNGLHLTAEVDRDRTANDNRKGNMAA